MKLRRLTLHNYRKFRHAELEFPEGIMAVIGHNGSGKSTLIEAIGWAIYGNVVARTTKEDIRRMGASASEECYVTLVFELGEDTYEVTRIMSGAHLTADAHAKINGVVAASSATGVTRLLEKKLGMDHDAFFTSLVARQKEINALSSKTPGERKRSMLRMLGIDAIEEAVRRVREDKKSKEQLIEALENALLDRDELQEKQRAAREEQKKGERRLKELKSAVSSLERKVEALKKERADMREKYQRYHHLEKERSRVQERWRITQSHLEEKEREVETLQEKKKQLTQLEPREREYQEVKERTEAMEEQRERYTAWKQLQKELEELEKRLQEKEQAIEEIQGQLADKEKVAQRVRGLREEEQQLTEQIKEKESATKIAQVHLATARQKQEEWEKKKRVIEEQGPESDCPTCGRPLGERYPDLLADFTAKIEEEKRKAVALEQEQQALRATLNELRKRDKEIKEQKKEAEQQLEELGKVEQRLLHLRESREELQHSREEKEKRSTELGEVSFDQESYAAAKDQLAHLQEVKERIIGLRSAVQRLPELRKTMAQVRQELQMLKEREESIATELAALDFDQERYESLEQSYEEKRQELQQRREQRINAAKDLERLQDEVQRLEEEMAEQQKKRRQIRNLRQEVQRLERLAGGRDSGLLNDFKRYLISRIGPLLSYYASSFLDVFTGGKYQQMEIDDNYDIFIYDQGEQFSINRFSGGEEDLANLSLRLAISQVIAERAGGVDFHFIVLDEIFGSQDSQRRSNVLDTLGELSSQFQQVILITHIEDIKDAMQYVIRTVEDEEGISHVQVE